MTSPSFVVAGLRSGVGKTTVTLGLIRALADRGLKTAALKIGPDFLDPSHYRSAGAVSSGNLDPIIQGTKGMMTVFGGSKNCDAVVIEGVMGLFDGPFPGKITASSADVASRLRLPVLLVSDARSCAQSIAAEILGARRLLKGVPLLGVVLNFVGSRRHAELLTKGIQNLARTKVLGCIFRDSLPPLPSRHLGLIPAMELKTGPYAEYGKVISTAISLDELCRNAGRRKNIHLKPSKKKMPGPNSNNKYPISVGIALDEAFSFYYPESIDYFNRHCQEVVFFSPLKDQTVPDVHLFYFGGGFPEIFARRLSANVQFRSALRQKLAAGAKAYAECGGLMYLSKSIVGTDGTEHPMTDHLPGGCAMHRSRQALGYWKARIRTNALFLKKDQVLIGHEYHWSSYVPAGLKTVYRASKIGAPGETQEGGWISKNAFASYLHLSPLGNPQFFKNLIDWAAR